MKTTRIAITLGRTLNLGNYNSCRAEYTEEVELDEEESSPDIRVQIQNTLRDRCELGIRKALDQARKVE